MTTTTPQLTPAVHRVAVHVVHGASVREIARKLCLTVAAVRGHLTKGRKLTGCPLGSSLAVYAHALLTHQLVPAPRPPRPGAHLSDGELLLLRAHSEYSARADIAQAAGIHRDDVQPETKALCDKVGAANPAHLVGIGHRLGLLTREPAEAER
ncbi:hypothetical protein ACWGLE_22105 [Streptomyces sp. NPDC055897]